MSRRHLLVLALILPGLLLAATLAAPHLNGGRALRILIGTPGQTIVMVAAPDQAPMSFTGGSSAGDEALLAAPSLRASTAGRSEHPDDLRLLAVASSGAVAIAGERSSTASLPGRRPGSAQRADGLGARAPPG